MQGLSDPHDRMLTARMRRWTSWYAGENAHVPNYDKAHRIIRSFFNGSRGPMLRQATALDWAGDPIVRRDPPRWKGKSYAGLPMSLTEPEFLIMYADFEEWKGSKTLEDADQEKRKYITYNLRNAALAKGWAEILRDPAHTPGAPIGDNYDFNDANEDIPF